VAQVEPLVVVDCGFVGPQGGEHVRMIGIRVNFERSLKDIADSRRTGVDIQLDRESRVRVEPRMQRENAPPAKDLHELFGEILWQKLAKGRTTVVVGRELAAKLPEDSSAFKLAVSGRPREFWAAGTVTEAHGKADFMKGNTVLMPVEDASALFYPAQFRLTADSLRQLEQDGVPDE